MTQPDPYWQKSDAERMKHMVEQCGFANGREALRVLQQYSLINQAAWDCKRRLNAALNTVDQVIRESEADKQAALRAVQMFAEIPGALGVGECPALQAATNDVSACVTELERDVAQIIAQLGGV